MKSIRVIGFGAMNLDELYRVQSVLADDETTIKEHKSTPGGSAANTIYGLAKLGINTGFAGAIGSDEEGKFLTEDFRNVGTDVSQIKIKDSAQTGSVLGLTDSHGKRALYVGPGANSLLKREDISLDYMAQAELIHLSSFADDEQFELQKWIVTNLPQSVKVSFTPGAIYTRKRLSALAPILAKTRILFTNESEIKELAKTKFFEAGAQRFLDKGCQMVIVTLGKGTLQKINTSQLTFEFVNYPKILSTYGTSDYMASENETELRFGSYVADANNKYIIESKPGHREDTTGAGDAFATGFLYGLLNRKGLEECGFLGDTVAQFSIAKMGARQGLPTLTELTQRYQELYSRQL